MEMLSCFGICDGVSPLSVALLCGNLPGDVRNDRCESVELSRMVGKTGQRVEVGGEMDDRPATCSIVHTVEKVDVDIRS
jgi:hypothetical protein